MPFEVGANTFARGYLELKGKKFIVRAHVCEIRRVYYTNDHLFTVYISPLCILLVFWFCGFLCDLNGAIDLTNYLHVLCEVLMRITHLKQEALMTNSILVTHC